MSKVKKTTYTEPGDIFHPGEFIHDELLAQNMSQQELANKMKVSKSEISSIIHGRRNINVKTAVLLEVVLGIDAEFWMNLQVKYDIELVKKKLKRSIKSANLSPARKKRLNRTVIAA